ncbi:unnamed protein product [Schistosoma turkestanicum]|nr:unnamed protein product [Schistosoma turkestanicum]
MLTNFNSVVLLKWYIITITIVQLFNFQLTHQAIYQIQTSEEEEVGNSNFPIELSKDIYVYQYSESIKYDEVSPVTFDKAATVTLGEYQTLIVKPIFKIWYAGLDMDYVEIFPGVYSNKDDIMDCFVKCFMCLYDSIYSILLT